MRVDVVAFTAQGCRLAREIARTLEGWDCHLFSKTTADVEGTESIDVPLRRWAGEAFERSRAIVFVGSVGIAVRSIAPHIRSKTTDPAVISVDELGTYVIPLLSGHIGGGNALAQRIAEGIGAEAVITTATDINHRISVDTFAVRNGLRIGSMSAAKEMSARILDDRFVGFVSDVIVNGDVPPELTPSTSGEAGIAISWRDGSSPFDATLHLIPLCHVIGVGCRKGTGAHDISEVVNDVLATEGISPLSIRAVASIDLKEDEEGLLGFCEEMDVDAVFLSAAELNGLPDMGYSSSEFVRDVTGVDCVCERSAVSQGGELVVRKTARNGVTVAVARLPYSVSFGRM